MNRKALALLGCLFALNNTVAARDRAAEQGADEAIRSIKNLLFSNDKPSSAGPQQVAPSEVGKQNFTVAGNTEAASEKQVSASNSAAEHTGEKPKEGPSNSITMTFPEDTAKIAEFYDLKFTEMSGNALKITMVAKFNMDCDMFTIDLRSVSDDGVISGSGKIQAVDGRVGKRMAISDLFLRYQGGRILAHEITCKNFSRTRPNLKVKLPDGA